MTDEGSLVAQSRHPVVPYAYYARIGSGHTPSRSNDAYWENCDIPWVTTGDVKHLRSGKLQVLTDTEHRISELGVRNSAARLHPEGTVFLSRTASVGFSGIMGRPMATSQDFVTWTPGQGLEARFLLWVLRALKANGDFNRMMYGSTHKTIYYDELAQLRGPLPSLEVQRQVADMLDAETARIDSLIAKNQRALDLVRLRREVTIGKLTSGGLDAGDPLEAFAEQPTIAPGWRVTKLKYVAERVTVGIVIRPAELYVDDPDDGVPCLRGVNIRRGEVTQDDLRYIGHEGNAANLKSKLRQSDVVIVRTGEAGVAAVVPDWAVGGNCVDLLLVRPGPRMDAKFVELVLNSDFVRRQVARGSVGSIQSHFNVASLSEAVLAVPEVSEQRRIVEEVRERVDPLDTLTRRVNNQIELLRTRRQALITAAVTGQITV